MFPAERNLTQPCTYWACTGSNDYGAPTLDAPVLLSSRWQDEEKQVRTLAGDEVSSVTTVYLSVRIAEQGFLAEGDFTAVSDPALCGGRQIQAFGVSPDLRNLSNQVRAYL